MSELSELKKSVDESIDKLGQRLHGRLDKALEDQNQIKIDFASHIGNPEIHQKPPCYTVTDHIANHKESKSTLLVGIGLVISGLGFVAYLIKEFFKGM